MTIVEYNSSYDIWVRFDTGNRVHTTMGNFAKGSVLNIYDKSVFGIGYIGEGKYSPKNTLHKRHYRLWYAMMRRCYSDTFKHNNLTYENCLVIEDWHNFQVFSEWVDQNYYEVNGHTTHLDKDILNKGNKIYSPDQCVFVPFNINMLFTKNNKYRGDLPIGVTFRKHGKYRVFCGINSKGKKVSLGDFYSVHEAFQTYKNYKEHLIRNIAEKFKNEIPKKLYDALISYEVEITD